MLDIIISILFIILIVLYFYYLIKAYIIARKTIDNKNLRYKYYRKLRNVNLVGIAVYTILKIFLKTDLAIIIVFLFANFLMRNMYLEFKNRSINNLWDEDENEKKDLEEVELLIDGEKSIELEACKRFTFNSHINCEFILNNTGISFIDNTDSKYSFEIPIELLTTAVFTEPKGLDDDLLIILENGEKYEVGFKKGDKEKVLKVINILIDAKNKKSSNIDNKNV